MVRGGFPFTQSKIEECLKIRVVVANYVYGMDSCGALPILPGFKTGIGPFDMVSHAGNRECYDIHCRGKVANRVVKDQLMCLGQAKHIMDSGFTLV